MNNLVTNNIPPKTGERLFYYISFCYLRHNSVMGIKNEQSGNYGVGWRMIRKQRD